MKDIKDFEGLYAVTSCGKVYSYRSKKFLKPRVHRDGYLIVALSKDYKKKQCFLHRLVAEAFIPNPDNLPQVNHRDEVKIHNSLQNLEWCTAKYNSQYSNDKKVLCVETGVIYNSITKAAEAVKGNKGNICKACNGKFKTSAGYHWNYIGDEI